MKRANHTTAIAFTVSLGFGLTFAASAQVGGDFNGDGFSDLAAAAPFENILAKIDAGGVHVLYGARTKLAGAGAQFWHQDLLPATDGAEIDDRLGAAMTSGDFNGDGFDDLAIGAPGEDFDIRYDAGAVVIIYGSATGLRATKNQFWHQDSAGINDEAEANDRFGAALAAGDFNNDGFADLAIGAPGENADAGLVHVIFGSTTGLTKAGDQMWFQGKTGVLDVAEAGDRFGAAVAASDFNRDGFADLAVGVPGQMVNGLANAGAVHLLWGSASKLSGAGNSLWHQDVFDVLDDAEEGDEFGARLRSGDFNNDGRMDLAVGIPLEDVDGFADAGAVQILYSGKNGIAAKNNQFWQQNILGMPETAEIGDRFGFALASGDFNKDGYDDLAIGAPYETIDVHTETGTVMVLRGSAARLTIASVQNWHQDTPNVAGENGVFDNFGASLAAADCNGDGRADLIVGVPGDDLGDLSDVGAIIVIYARSGGLNSSGGQFWHQNATGLGDECEAADYFGDCLGQ